MLEADRPRKLSMRWLNEGFPEMKAEGPTFITYELEQQGSVVKLTLTQTSPLDDCKVIGPFDVSEWDLDRTLPFSLRHTCDLIHGSSGSGLIDAKTGKVLGVNWGGIKIAIENCPMLWDDTWPGGQNVAYSPSIWTKMFEIIPDENFGLNYDPSHLVWQFIDEIRPITDFKDRIFHVHAKDMHIDREMLYRDGILAPGFNWAIPKLPGLGDVRWPQFMAAFYAIGYDYVISIEHEDRTFEGTEELVKRGFYLTRDVLSPYIK